MVRASSHLHYPHARALALSSEKCPILTSIFIVSENK